MAKKYIIGALFVFVILAIFLFPGFTPNPATPSSPAPPKTGANIKTPTLTPIPSPFPGQYLIKTAFIEQAPEKNWDQPWQDACEEAALLTVDFFYKNQKPNSQQTARAILAMIDFETNQGFDKDVNIDQMAQIGQQYLGYSATVLDQPSLLQIKQYLISDIPVIIPANGKLLYQENHYFSNGGPYYHNLIILGFNDRQSQFTVHDVGTRHGAYFTYSYQLLMDSIHDFPNSGHKEDIAAGTKKALVLLK